MKKKILILTGTYLLLLPQVIFGLEPQNKDYPKVPIGINQTLDLNQIIKNPSPNMLGDLAQYIYYFILAISGMAAFVMLLWGGIQYLTSSGNSSMMSDAKDRIFKAFLGIVILLSSYLILNTINPNLVLLPPPTIQIAVMPTTSTPEGKIIFLYSDEYYKGTLCDSFSATSLASEKATRICPNVPLRSFKRIGPVAYSPVEDNAVVVVFFENEGFGGKQICFSNSKPTIDMAYFVLRQPKGPGSLKIITGKALKDKNYCNGWLGMTFNPGA